MVVSRWPVSVGAVVVVASLPRGCVLCVNLFVLCGLLWGRVRKSSPSALKHPNFGVFVIAGRTISRVKWGRGRAGWVFSRKCRWKPPPGRTLSRVSPRGPADGRACEPQVGAPRPPFRRIPAVSPKVTPTPTS